jgi:hypothetical protein
MTPRRRVFDEKIISAVSCGHFGDFAVKTKSGRFDELALFSLCGAVEMLGFDRFPIAANVTAPTL